MADEARPAAPVAKDDTAPSGKETPDQPQAPEQPQSQSQTEGPTADQPEQRPAEEAPKQTNAISIQLRDGVQNVLHFKIKSTTTLRKVMDAFCERVSADRLSKRFLFDGVPINEDDTPEKASE